MKEIISIILIVVIFAACADTNPPSEAEPTLSVSVAEDISRTSAAIYVNIEKDPSTTLSYLNLSYGTAPNLYLSLSRQNVEASVVKFDLTDLTPGTVYYCFAEGGTATARFRSQTVSFSTVPNSLPSVSQIGVLSSGPTGVLVEFDIPDDGGTDILSAGCEFQESSPRDPNQHRILLPADQLKKGTHQLYITGLSPLTSYSISAFASNSMGETISNPIQFFTMSGVILTEAGTLSYIFGSEGFSGRSLSIAGNMNGSDFRFLRTLKSVEELNLTDANIVAGGEPYDGARFTENNIISTDLFADCSNLKSIILPNSATEISRNAFARCSSLETINVPANVESVKPSSDCPSLKEIKVSEANKSFAAVSGVLFNKDSTRLLWFPAGKSGNFVLSDNVTCIGENAFSGANIGSMTIPNSVTTIERGAFSGSALEEIALPDHLTNVSESMFQNCVSLHVVKLGAATEFIGNYVFDGTSLTALYIAAQYPPYVSADAFLTKSYDLAAKCVLYVPKGAKAAYRNHPMWGRFTIINEY